MEIDYEHGVQHIFTTIGEHTVEYEIPNDEDTFYGHIYNSLDVTLPEGIKIIKHGCFGDGTGQGVYRNVGLPTTLEVIEDGVFSRGFFLLGNTGVTIPSAIIIGDYAFAYCRNWDDEELGLKRIELPANLESVGRGCFASSILLSSITCHAATAPSLGIDAFMYTASTGTLYYPAGSDYSSWLSALNYTSGRNWTGVEI